LKVNRRKLRPRSLYYPPETVPLGGRPRDARSWADSAYLQGRTQTMAILTMSRSVSTFDSTIRRQSQELFLPLLTVFGRCSPRSKSRFLLPYTLSSRPFQVGRTVQVPASTENR
jgi:hypothetical protein